jgi:hypothetical protein
MVTQPDLRPGDGPSSPLLERLVPYSRHITTFFLVLAGVMAAFALWALTTSKWDYFQPRFLWAVLVGLEFLVVGLLNAASRGEQLSPVERLRVLLLTAGALVGLTTALVGLLLPFTTEYKPVFAGGLAEWRANKDKILWPLAATLGGLAVLFLSLQLARGQERTSGLMRRLLYGYNAVLSCLVLLLILLLVNVLAYARIPPFTALNKTYDWTSSGIYTLSDRTRAYLAQLQEPVKVYVLSPNEVVSREMGNLLESMRSASPNITWETVSRDRSRPVLAKLEEKYKIPDPVGVLVVYGKEGNEVSEFISLRDIFGSQDPEAGAIRFSFAGEDAVMKAIDYLASGKAKAKIYFAQGHGELDFNNHNVGRPDEGIGVLISQLSRGNYEPKELKFGPEGTTIPEDAEVVVIARPRSHWPARDVDALRAYLKGDGRKKKGRLMVMLDVISRDGKMLQTGLEPLLAEFNVRAGDDRVVAVEALQYRDNPVDLEVFANPMAANALARSFLVSRDRDVLFNFYDARTVGALSEGNPGAAGSPFTVDQVIIEPPNYLIWTLTDLNKDPVAVVRDVIKSRKTLQDTISQRPLCLAVTVSEPKAAMPQNPHDFRNREGEGRMVVFGDATWVSNAFMAAGGREGGSARARNHLDLFTSSVNWLRGRADLGPGGWGETKTRKEVVLNVKQDDVLRVLMLPGALMILAIFGLGIGVWVVRRR